MAEKTIAYLGSPRTDLAAKQVVVTLRGKWVPGCRLFVDPDNELDEVFEENNVVNPYLNPLSFGYGHLKQIQRAKKSAKTKRLSKAEKPPLEGKMAEVVHQIRVFDTAIVAYKIKFRELPENLSALVDPPSGAPILRVASVPYDPWGNPYEFRLTRNGRAWVIICRTPDGVEIRSDNLPG